MRKARRASKASSIDTEFDPVKHAFEYPFNEVGTSFLVERDRISKLSFTENSRVDYFTVENQEERGLPEFLDSYLQRKGYAEVGNRYPVVSFGSLRNPDRIAQNFRDIGQFAVPVIRATLFDFDAVYPAHISKYGVITSTLAPSGGTELLVHVLFVDDMQMKILHDAESTGELFDFYRVAPAKLVLENKEVLDHANAFINRFGALRISGKPRRLVKVKAESAKFSAAELKEVSKYAISILRGAGERVRTQEDLQRLALESDETRKRIRGHLHLSAVHLAVPGRKLNSERNTKPMPLERYKETRTAILKGKNEFVAAETRVADHIRGTYTIKLNPRMAEIAGLLAERGKEVAVVNRFDKRPGDTLTLAAGGKLQIDTLVPSGQAKVEKTLRTAIGLRAGDPVCVMPIRSSIWTSLREKCAKLIGTQYIYCRVEKTYYPDMEKRICRLPHEALEAIGALSGNRVVIQSLSSTEGEKSFTWRTLQIKCFLADKDIIRERKAKYGKSSQAYYPDYSHILGTPNDVYPIFLDRQARDDLELNQNGLVVRVRRETRDALTQEILPILVVALGGALSFGADSRIYGLILFAALGVYLVWKNVRKKVP